MALIIKYMKYCYAWYKKYGFRRIYRLKLASATIGTGRLMSFSEFKDREMWLDVARARLIKKPYRLHGPTHWASESQRVQYRNQQ